MNWIIFCYWVQLWFSILKIILKDFIIKCYTRIVYVTDKCFIKILENIGKIRKIKKCDFNLFPYSD